MSSKIVIVGAGIGGLTAALTLLEAGFDVQIHEQVSELREVGAGLTLSRGAQHVFRTLGAQTRLAPYATPAAAFPFLHYRTGAVLSGKIDHGRGASDDGSADVARQCHRADLQQVLLTLLQERDPAALHLNHRATDFQVTADAVEVRFENGDRADGDALIVADGVKSQIRERLCADGPPRFTHQVAFRFLVPRDRAAPILRFGRGAVFIGPGATFNRYSLRGGSLLNCVALMPSERWTDDGWSIPAAPEELAGALRDWHPEVLELIAQSESLVKWGLFDRAPVSSWSRGRVSLLGDAAHAMLPFLGMGAAMAIEDAIMLARAFQLERTVEAALRRYENVRRPRTLWVQEQSRRQGQLVQAMDPERYDAHAAPALDPEILAYNPVTAPI